MFNLQCFENYHFANCQLGDCCGTFFLIKLSLAPIIIKMCSDTCFVIYALVLNADKMFFRRVLFVLDIGELICLRI